MSRKIEHLIIIGNGFDLEHKLPTSFNNFISSTNKQFFLEKNIFVNWFDFEKELFSNSNDSFLWVNRVNGKQEQKERIRLLNVLMKNLKNELIILTKLKYQN